MLIYNGEVWLPNIKCISSYISKCSETLSRYYTIERTNDIFANPLVEATEVVTDVLLKDNKIPLINSNQLIRLDQIYPFYRLKFNK
jgi:hypothetical protein